VRGPACVLNFPDLATSQTNNKIPFSTGDGNLSSSFILGNCNSFDCTLMILFVSGPTKILCKVFSYIRLICGS
jgi:hypothetical protein